MSGSPPNNAPQVTPHRSVQFDRWYSLAGGACAFRYWKRGAAEMSAQSAGQPDDEQSHRDHRNHARPDGMLSP